MLTQATTDPARPGVSDADAAPWRQHYDPAVPTQIAYPRVPLYRLLDDAAARHPERACARFFGRRFSYRQIQEQADRFVAAMGELGVCKGDRVALLLPNVPQFISAYFGLLKAGAVVVLLNPLATSEQLAAQISDAGARIVISLPLFLDTLVPLLGVTPLARIIYCRVADALPFPLSLAQRAQELRLCARHKSPALLDAARLLQQAVQATIPPAPAAPDETAVIIYSSGTTGAAKGIALSHFNCVASAYQLAAWVQLGERDRILAILPLFHIFGMSVTMNAPIVAGVETILLPRFDAREALRTIQRDRPTFFTGVPGMFVAFSHLPDVARYDLSSLKCIFVGGAPLTQAIKETFESRTGARMIEGYGLTEAMPVTATPYHGRSKPGSVGVPFPDVALKVVSLDDGQELAPGEWGEIVVRSPVMTRGYYGQERETRAAIVDGWLHTGDVGYIDADGFVFVMDRTKELIYVDGGRIFPREIDELLYRHPQVKEGVTVGIPDAERGERIKAFVVLKDGQTVAPEEILAYLGAQLPAYKVPSELEVRAELPKSPIGKIVRRILREEAIHNG